MDDMDSSVEVLKALADSTRLRVFAALMERGETCVCELVELLGTTHSNLSFHLNKLKAAGLIRSRKVGKWMFYSPDRARIADVRDWLAARLDTTRTPHTPAEQSMAAICCGRDIPLSLREVTLRKKDGDVVAELV